GRPRRAAGLRAVQTACSGSDSELNVVVGIYLLARSEFTCSASQHGTRLGFRYLRRSQFAPMTREPAHHGPRPYLRAVSAPVNGTPRPRGPFRRLARDFPPTGAALRGPSPKGRLGEARAGVRAPASSIRLCASPRSTARRGP